MDDKLNYFVLFFVTEVQRRKMLKKLSVVFIRNVTKFHRQLNKFKMNPIIPF